MLQFESLGLLEAEKAIAAGIAAAQSLGKAMAFAVADQAGEMIATARMDGANPRILRHSVRKAHTAALMCRHTLSFKRDLEERAGGLDQWGDAKLTTLPGGLVVQRNGKFVGAVGAGGGGPDDEKIARAMVTAMGFEIVEDARAQRP
jgi:glc operon protein GlcG